MSINVRSQMVANVNIQAVTLQPVLGSYELMFGLELHVSSNSEEIQRISIAGADVTISAGAEGSHRLGFARPRGFFNIRTYEFSNRYSHALYMPLQPRQIGAIEELRNGGDLEFELNAWGEYMDGADKEQVNDTWRRQLAKSDWLIQLQNARAMDVQLIEVPMPAVDNNGDWHEMAEHLKSAERHFLNGEYTAVVASCRVAIDEFGLKVYNRESWQNDFNDKFVRDRKNMQMEDREGLILSAIRHYAHQAHHGSGDGGKTYYSRSQAKRTLALTAAVIAHAREA